ISMVVLFAGAVAWAGQGNPDDAKSLDDVVDAWTAGYNAHDAKAVAAIYTEDADLVLPLSGRLKGREAIEKDLAEFLAKNPNVRLKQAVSSRRFLKPDVAVIDGEWEERGHSEEGRPTRGLFTTVLVKLQGKWWFVCDRAYVPVSGAGASKTSEKK